MRLLIAATLLVLAPTLAAATELGLAETASRDVENDRFVARLEGRAEAGAPAAAQGELNALIERALDRLADTPALDVQTGGYRVAPERRDEDAPVRWVATQDLTVEGDAREALVAAVAALQELGLTTQGLGSRLSDARADGVRDALIREAMARLRARATVAARALDLEVAGWLRVQIDGARPMPRTAQAEAAMMRADAAPSLTVGTTTVRVTVEGTAELVAQDER